MIPLITVWNRLKTTPEWVWGAVAGAGTIVLLWFKIKKADDQVVFAEREATEAKLDRDAALDTATIELSQEDVVELDEERAAIRKRAAEEHQEALEMSDEETARWLQHDAEARLKDKA
jgi:hypothetical protein